MIPRIVGTTDYIAWTVQLHVLHGIMAECGRPHPKNKHSMNGKASRHRHRIMRCGYPPFGGVREDETEWHSPSSEHFSGAWEPR